MRKNTPRPDLPAWAHDIVRDAPALLTRDEAAKRGRVATRTLDRAIRRGELAIVRIGTRVLVPAAALAAYVASRAQGASLSA